MAEAEQSNEVLGLEHGESIEWEDDGTSLDLTCFDDQSYGAVHVHLDAPRARRLRDALSAWLDAQAQVHG